MRLLAFAILALFSSCSHLSENLNKRGEVRLKGGYYGSAKWSDDLTFKRISWYKGLTLSFDLLHTKIDRSSRFYQWFSTSEKDSLARCKEYYIVAAYAHDDRLVSISDFISAANKSGYDHFNLSQFADYLKMHPDAGNLATNSYKFYGLCLRSASDGDYIRIQFPGFKEIIIR